MNKFLKNRSILFLGIGIFAGIFGFLAPKYHVVPIIMFHRVETADFYKPNLINPENFEYQIDYLSKHHYKVISLDTLVTAIKEGRKLEKKSLVITFDDGTEDNYTVAFPILKKYNFPATIFLISKYIDKEGFLKSDQILEMQNSVIQFGSHTQTHPYLPEVSSDIQKKEIQESKIDLEKFLGRPVEYFAYPSGGYNDDIVQLLKEAGYKGAVTTNRGLTRYNKNIYELKRVRFSNRDVNGLSMWAKLSGYYNFFRNTRNPS